MATYAELFDLRSHSALKNRVSVGCIIAAEVIRGEDSGTANHTNRLTWAKAVFENPEHESTRMLWALLAANNTLTVAQLTGVTDANLQTSINNAVNLFASG